MDFHAHQVISRYLVFYVFRKKKQKNVRKLFQSTDIFYYFIMRSDLLDPSSDLPEF